MRNNRRMHSLSVHPLVRHQHNEPLARLVCVCMNVIFLISIHIFVINASPPVGRPSDIPSAFGNACNGAHVFLVSFLKLPPLYSWGNNYYF